MRKIIMVGQHFMRGESPAHGEVVLRTLLLAQCLINADWLQHHRRAPMLYQSGVRYVMEPQGVEEFRDIPTIMEAGCGDCDDLGCWRVAECWVRDKVNVKPIFTKRTMADGRFMYHILVRYPNGDIEDPSKILGMGRNQG